MPSISGKINFIDSALSALEARIMKDDFFESPGADATIERLLRIWSKLSELKKTEKSLLDAQKKSFPTARSRKKSSDKSLIENLKVKIAALAETKPDQEEGPG